MKADAEWSLSRFIDRRFDLITIEQIERRWFQLAEQDQLLIWTRCREQCSNSNIRLFCLLKYGIVLSESNRIKLQIHENGYEKIEQSNFRKRAQIIGVKDVKGRSKSRK